MRVHRYYPFSAEQTAVAVNVYRSAHSVPMHRHMFWELFLAVRGTCRHTGAAGETTLLPGDLCAVPPHADHCFEMQDSVEIYNCQCWPEQLNEDPYGAWIAKIGQITDKVELLDVAAYEAFTQEEA